MKKFILLSMPALLIVMFVCTAYTNSEKDEVPKFSHTVKLDISGDDEIKNQVYSYISRELLSLGDVELVEDTPGWLDDPQWIIKIVACPVDLTDGGKSGLVLSTVILRTIDFRKHKSLEKRWNVNLKVLENYFPFAVHFKKNTIHCGSLDGLERWGQDIVADFDTTYLKPKRKWRREAKTLYEMYGEPRKPKDKQKQ